MKKLKPCPSCGSANVCGLNEAYVSCNDCYMNGPMKDAHGERWDALPRREIRSIPDVFADVGRFNDTGETSNFRLHIDATGEDVRSAWDHVGKQAMMHLGEELSEIEQAFDEGDVAGIADGLVDIVYVAIGMAHRLGLPFEDVWDEVHRANMAKFPDGQVFKNENGKITKPPGWKPPDIEGVLRRHDSNKEKI